MTLTLTLAGPSILSEIIQWCSTVDHALCILAPTSRYCQYQLDNEVWPARNPDPYPMACAVFRSGDMEQSPRPHPYRCLCTSPSGVQTYAPYIQTHVWGLDVGTSGPEGLSAWGGSLGAAFS